MSSPVAPANPPTYLIVNSQGNASLTVAPQQAAGPLMQVVITGSGAGYTAGVTYNVALTGGSGSGAQAAVVVTGNVVTGVNITANGTGYAISDVLTVPGGTTSATVIVTYLPSSSVTTLELSGVNALNWGSNIWESLYRLTESFAAPTAPGANAILGGTNVTPLQGQLWFDTSNQSLNVFTTGGWVALETGAIVAVNGTAPINISTVSNIATVSLATSGVTAGSYTNTNITVDAFGRITSASTGTTGNPGTVVSVNASTGASNGLTITGGPITSSGTLTFTLGTELQGLSMLNTLGFVQRTASGTYTASALNSSQLTNALGYTPYNATNPAGYITGNQTITLSGALSGSGTTSIVTTLANSGVTTGTYGNSTNVPSITVNSKGLVTSASTSAIPTFAGSSPGLVPTSPGGTSEVLLANGTWGTPNGSILTAVCTANQTYSNGAYNVSSYLQVPLAANSYYAFKIFVWLSAYADPCWVAPVYNGTQTVGFFNVQYNDPGGSGIVLTNYGVFPSITNVGGIPQNQYNATVPDQSPSSIVIEGMIGTITASTFYLKFGPYGSGSGSYATLNKGSYMIVTKLG